MVLGSAVTGDTHKMTREVPAGGKGCNERNGFTPSDHTTSRPWQPERNRANIVSLDSSFIQRGGGTLSEPKTGFSIGKLNGGGVFERGGDTCDLNKKPGWASFVGRRGWE